MPPNHQPFPGDSSHDLAHDPSDRASRPPIVPPTSALEPDDAFAPLLPPGLWSRFPIAAQQSLPKLSRPDRPNVLWRPADGTVAVPALRDGSWQYALISREDAPWVLASNWFVKKGGYAFRNTVVAGKKAQQYLHRLVRCTADGKDILQVPVTDLVDHKNVQPLDCRRRNLRWSDSSLNQQNIGREHPGVTWREYRQRWWARIHWQGREIHVGYSRSKSHAIRMRAAKAKELGIPLNGEAV